ncbi:MAG: histidine--tRNA ligase [Deltaproteobacteria bacterium]|nr:MAG: histidine--tRNA ligase [Deltaproteobacteria bacterium]
MRDFLPRDIARREYVVSLVRRVYERYGFVPLETPAVESLAILSGKYGEDEKLIYRILHRGEALRRVLDRAENAAALGADDLSEEALRYDLTVPLARVVAQYGGVLPKYFKRYQIQPVWRADRPGKGRFREFYQCDVDAIGSRGRIPEAEVLSAVSEALSELRLDDHEIRINHRGLLRAVLDVAGVPEDLGTSALTALDKLDKIGVEGVRTELRERGIDDGAAARLLDLVAADEDRGDPKARVRALAARLGGVGEDVAAELAELFEVLDVTPAVGRVRFDPALARGLGYYTGAIFEVRLTDFGSSVAGGGRYDGLIGMFGKQAVPAVGCSIGLERILVVLDERGLFPPLRVGPDAVVCWFGVPAACVLSVARTLREGGARVEVFPDAAKLGKQLAYAAQDAVGARFAVIVGPDEAAEGMVSVKDLESGEQVRVATSEAAALVARGPGALEAPSKAT